MIHLQKARPSDALNGSCLILPFSHLFYPHISLKKLFIKILYKRFCPLTRSPFPPQPDPRLATGPVRLPVLRAQVHWTDGTSISTQCLSLSPLPPPLFPDRVRIKYVHYFTQLPLNVLFLCIIDPYCPIR